LDSTDITREAATILERLSSDYCFKLALIHALSRHADAQYADEVDMQWATKVVEYLGKNLDVLITEEITFNHFDAAQKDVYDFIERSKSNGVTTSDITAKKRKYKPNQLREILESLSDSGRIQSIRLEPGARGGRPAYRHYADAYAPMR
jgi:hypothetical protein